MEKKTILKTKSFGQTNSPFAQLDASLISRWHKGTSNGRNEHTLLQRRDQASKNQMNGKNPLNFNDKRCLAEKEQRFDLE